MEDEKKKTHTQHSSSTQFIAVKSNRNFSMLYQGTHALELGAIFGAHALHSSET